jgi:CRISPR-associated protein Cas2
MFVLVCYDVADDKRRRRIAEVLEGYGQRVQRSVFECHLRPARLASLQRRVARLLDTDEDRVGYYTLCAKDRAGIATDGIGTVTRDWDYRIV